MGLEAWCIYPPWRWYISESESRPNRTNRLLTKWYKNRCNLKTYGRRGAFLDAMGDTARNRNDFAVPIKGRDASFLNDLVVFGVTDFWNKVHDLELVKVVKIQKHFEFTLATADFAAYASWALWRRGNFLPFSEKIPIAKSPSSSATCSIESK